ncbi:MAG: sodium:proton antiporter [Chitinophagales bacterium]|nr:sodium:proton antiporter [Chitinophagales bacterium]
MAQFTKRLAGIILLMLPLAVFGSPMHTAAEPALWSIIPFLLLLGMIATGPIFYHHFWERNYPVIASVIGIAVVIYYLAFLHDLHHPIHSLSEYFSFISLVGSMYVVSGGILIKIDQEATPRVNAILLFCGAVLANVIGTIGASMLLIRPFIRINKDRLEHYHVVFFIFIVSNVGGCLTPIGDPPLFLGFLKGVPFQWTLFHAWPMWLFAVGSLVAIFFVYDRRNVLRDRPVIVKRSGKVVVLGKQNFIFIAIILAAIFIDPNVLPLPWGTYIDYHGDKLSFLRELIMLLTAAIAYRMADIKALQGNEFNFEPIKEVGYLFIGIFMSMMPALQIIGKMAAENPQVVTENSLFWLTGSLSAVLDNAPTYLNFLSAAMGKLGLSLDNKADVVAFTKGIPHEVSVRYLLAVSISSVFFGACTYIGNAPNFMVKSITEQIGLKMPSFTTYFTRYALPILLPVITLTWLIFFVLLA